MKSKILGLMTLSILALVLVIGLTSAAVDFVPSSFTPTVEQGDSVTLSFQVQESNVEALTGITFGTPITFTSGIYTFDSATSVSGAITILAQNATSSTMSITINVPEAQTPGPYTGDLTLTDLTYSPIINDLSIALTVTEKPRPTEVNDCLAIGDSNDLMELEIEEITVTGLGEEDDEWVPLDTIEVEVKVENTEKDFKLEDVEVSWGLYNLDTQEWVFDEEESDFNIKDDEEETLTFKFTLEDPEDFEEGGDFVFYVWANAVGEESDTPVCMVVSEDINVIVESDFLVLDNFQIEGIDLEDREYPDTLSCGSTLHLTADIWNIGDADQEDIEIRVYNSDLGIDELLEIGDVDSFDSESISFEFTIPEGMEESWYELEFTIQEDGDVFENDYTDDDAVFNILLDVGENCALAQAFVSASLDEGGKAGKELIVRATIKNTGTKSTSYLVNAVGYVEWASLINVDPSTITLEAGQSADVLIALKVNGDVSGERLFNIEVLSEGELVVSQPLSVSVEKALIGDLFGDNGLLTALIIGIALILVIIIIVLAIRVARR